MAKTEYCVMNGEVAGGGGGGGSCTATTTETKIIKDPNNNNDTNEGSSGSNNDARSKTTKTTKMMTTTMNGKAASPPSAIASSSSSSSTTTTFSKPYSEHEDLSCFIADWAAPPPPPLLLHIGLASLLLACVLSELLSWSAALALFTAFRMLCSDYARRALRTMPRDAKGILVLIWIKLKMRRAFRRNAPVHAHFLDLVRRLPDKQCVVEVDTGRSMTFVQFNAHTNAYAHLFQDLDFGCSDVLALFMENSIEFFAAWLGASKLGVVTAWINTNLKGEPLGHSVRVAKCKAVLTTPTMLPVLQRAIANGHLPSHLPIFIVLDAGQRVGELDPAMQLLEAQQQHSDNSNTTLQQSPTFAREHSLKDSELEPARPSGLNFQSVLCYIYTSGTTGVPKAAVIRHSRYFLMGTAIGQAFGVRHSDRLYITLPMYHSAGGILGTSQVLIRGCTACIRTKFSASNFWRDCIRFDCTVSQYIGELCRYLLAQPHAPADRAHHVRLLFGNGLRPQIWGEFVQRFGIDKIGEVYGSTEGNCSLLNLDNRAGAVGFINIYAFMAWIQPMRLLKVDPESGELIRDERGFCIPCRPGDTGEMVGIIKDKDPIMRFEGYVNQGDTQQKILKNCCFPGDTVFTSGDIMYWDLLGYMYFKDRRGDTYRWRGENVSTTEVEGVLQPLKCILDATVYGVEVPGREGRAGMIGLTLANETDIEDFLDQISARLVDHLASYAIPVFLRICDHVDRTATFKLKKTELQRDGYHLDRCAGNQVFYWDAARRHYMKLDAEMQERIDSGSYKQI